LDNILFFVFIFAAVACDALKDAYYWVNIYSSKRETLPITWLICKGNWHSIKYAGMVFFMLAGFILGIKSTHGLPLLELCAATIMSWSIWETVYRYAVYGDLSFTHNEELHIPFFEKRIALSGMRLFVFHVTIWTVFAILLYLILSGE